MIHYNSQSLKKQYKKISKEKSLKLINMVFSLSFRIKNAAQVLNINYATAKNIVRRFRQTHIFKVLQKGTDGKRCSYRPIQDGIYSMGIVSLRSGQLQSVYSVRSN